MNAATTTASLSTSSSSSSLYTQGQQQTPVAASFTSMSALQAPPPAVMGSAAAMLLPPFPEYGQSTLTTEEGNEDAVDESLLELMLYVGQDDDAWLVENAMSSSTPPSQPQTPYNQHDSGSSVASITSSVSGGTISSEDAMEQDEAEPQYIFSADQVACIRSCE